MSLFLYQLAQIRWTNPALSSSVRGLRGWEYFQLILPDFVTLGLIIGVVVFVFVFMIGAIQWILAGADKAAVESARKKIVNAIVGLFILLLLFMLLQLFNLVFGIDIGNIGTPTGPGGGSGGGGSGSATSTPSTSSGTCTPAGNVCSCSCPSGSYPVTGCGGGGCGGTCSCQSTPSGSSVQLNVSSDQSCTQVCSGSGRTCLAIGTNSGGSDGTFWEWDELNVDCRLVIGSCGSVMTDVSQVPGLSYPPGFSCGGHTLRWTNCLCSP